MKRILGVPFLLALTAFGCGGSWSNRDLEFANALPNRAELSSKLPEASSSSSPLSGPSTRRDGLEVGASSTAYSDTRNAATNFNGILDLFLTLLDKVRQVPPTSRTADSRIWGPYPDGSNPGYTGQVRVQQNTADTFSWWLEERPSQGAFFSVVTGDFEASSTAKKGKGTMIVHVKDFRDVLKVDDNIRKLDAITIGYDTRAYPIEVTMTFVDAGGPRLSYLYDENADRSGAMDFILNNPADPNVTSEKITARWNAAGAGRTDALVLSGAYATAGLIQCWDTSFKVSYYHESWPGGQTSGDPSNCAVPAP